MLHRADPHRVRPLATMDLPQPDRLEHLLSRNRAALEVEYSQHGGPAVVDLLANDSARNLRLSPEAPCRAVLRTSSRKQERTTAPKVPSAEGDSRWEVARPTRHRSGGGRTSGAFVSTIHVRPDSSPRNGGSAPLNHIGPKILVQERRSALHDICDRNSSLADVSFPVKP